MMGASDDFLPVELVAMVPATARLSTEGALRAMFVTRMKFAVLACGLLAAGAVATAQQSGRNRPARSTIPTTADAIGNSTKPGTTSLANPSRNNADADIEKEMQQLEVDLLDEEVKILHDNVSGALKEIIQYRTSTTTADPKAAAEAEHAYEVARQVYLRRARELAIARRRLGKSDATAKDDRKPKDAAPPKDAVEGSQGSGGARIGSVDMQAIRVRYERLRRDKPPVDSQEDMARFGRLQHELVVIRDQMKKLPAGSAEYRAREARLRSVYDRLQYENANERNQKEKDDTLNDIREVVAEVARSRGLDYVIRAFPGRPADADKGGVSAGWDQPILYANPRNDITEEVIREWNRRYEASAEKSPR